jgi:hypothetical protein
MKIGKIEYPQPGQEPMSLAAKFREDARRMLAESDDMARDMASRHMAFGEPAAGTA